MRRKTLCGESAATSIKPEPAPGTGGEVPILCQNEYSVAVLKASLESNHDLADVREDVSKGSINNDMGEGSNRSSRESLDDDDICLTFLGRKSCISCNEGGEVLVCAERDCPVNLHAKCLCIEPKFDDKGNFFCPYCWYKRAWAEAEESRRKAFLAKKDLSKFFFQNGITSDRLAENDVGIEMREPDKVSVLGNGSGLDYHNRPGNKSLHSQPLRTLQDEQKEGEILMSGTDQHEIAVGDIAHANGPEANSCDSKCYREEMTPVHIDLDHKFGNGEKFDIVYNNISKTHETRFVEGQQGIELEDLRYNNEYAHAMIVKDAKPLSAFRFGESLDGPLPDDAFARGMQGVEISLDKCRVKGREKLVQSELNPSVTDCSVSETGDSDSEPLLMKESHDKQGEQRTSCTQGVPPVWKSLPQKSITGGETACYKKEEVANSETGKRKRLNWTVEEVNMLKEGVLRFSMDQRNIPWKKILEFGCHVFHSKRNTADLKDKWKHMRV